MGIVLTPRSTASHSGVNRRVCAAAAVLSALLVFLWMAAHIHYAFGGNWTAAFYTGTIFPVPPDIEAGTYRFQGPGYDGQFFRDLAQDPFLRKGYFRYVDYPQRRFRRLLVPLAAWLLGCGQRDWIDGAYVALEMLFLALGVYWCARLLIRRGRSPLWGLLFVVVPAALASFDRMLVDGPLTALFAGFLLYCEEERWNRVWVLAMLAALTRETGLLLPAALVLERLWHRDWRRALWFASSAIPAAAWYAYVAFRLPHDPPISGLGFPGLGLLRRLFWLRPYPYSQFQFFLRVTDFLGVLGLAVCILIAVRWLWAARPNAVTLSVALFAAVTVVLSSLPGYMTEAFAFARPVSPLLLWIMIEAVSRKKWAALAPPLLVSLSVSLVFGSQLVAVIRGVLAR